MTFVLLGIAEEVACGVMTIAWLISLRLSNAGIVDIAWAGLFAPLALLYSAIGDGALERRIVAASMMILWSIRLASHLGGRVLADLGVEHGRYAALRAHWGEAADSRMFWLFQSQGAAGVILSVPVLIASLDPNPVLGAWEFAGIAVWLTGLVGESVADAQLRQFKADPANRGRVCTSGLWRLSRHPNYFFEWLVWWGYALFAMGSPYGWITFYCPLVMFWFLYRVTGIPATEDQAVRTRGAEYRAYQATTSAFVPWFSSKDSGGF